MTTANCQQQKTGYEVKFKLERLFNAEFDDIKEDSEESMSIEDRVAKEMMIETTTLVDGHYQIGLPFKHNPPNLPDSLPTAKKRLQYLKDKMNRNPKFHEKYSKVMKNYVDEGAAREVPEDEVVKLKPLCTYPTTRFGTQENPKNRESFSIVRVKPKAFR